jgi:hypothetical protein
MVARNNDRHCNAGSIVASAMFLEEIAKAHTT